MRHDRAVRITPVTPDVLVDEIVALVDARPGRVRLALDGPPPTRPVELARRVADRAADARAGRAGRRRRRLPAPGVGAPRVRPRGPRRVPRRLARRRRAAPGGARPRPVRGGSGRVLPRLWDAAADRAHRDGYTELPDDGVVVLAGALLLGRGLPLELAVHLRMSESALWPGPCRPVSAGRSPPTPATRPSAIPGDDADLLVLADHPDRPAVRRRDGVREKTTGVGEEGVEPSRPYGHTDLNRARLPFRHSPWPGKASTVAEGSVRPRVGPPSAPSGSTDTIGGASNTPMRTEDGRVGRVGRFERRLQGMVGDAFARVFGGSVVPQEVVQALLREAEDHIEQLAGGRLLAPNRYTVLLSPSDLDRMAGDREQVVTRSPPRSPSNSPTRGGTPTARS